MINNLDLETVSYSTNLACIEVFDNNSKVIVGTVRQGLGFVKRTVDEKF